MYPKAFHSNFCFNPFSSINFHKTFWTFLAPYELLLFLPQPPSSLSSALYTKWAFASLSYFSLGFFFSRNNVHKILWIFIVRPKKFFPLRRLLLLRALPLAALHGWKSKSIFLIFSLLILLEKEKRKFSRWEDFPRERIFFRFSAEVNFSSLASSTFWGSESTKIKWKFTFLPFAIKNAITLLDFHSV